MPDYPARIVWDPENPDAYSAPDEGVPAKGGGRGTPSPGAERPGLAPVAMVWASRTGGDPHVCTVLLDATIRCTCPNGAARLDATCHAARRTRAIVDAIGAGLIAV
jgi:hypothetical protein